MVATRDFPVPDHMRAQFDRKVALSPVRTVIGNVETSINRDLGVGGLREGRLRRVNKEPGRAPLSPRLGGASTRTLQGRS